MSAFTPEQLLARRNTLGASEIAAVAGLSPWQSQHDTWLVKRGLADELGDVRTRMGSRVEACVLAEYCEDQGVKVESPGTLIHSRESWMSATPDGLVVDPRRVLEIKCVGWRLASHWGTDPDAIPPYYRAQVAWQMEVTGLDEAHVAAWIGGSDFRIYTIRRDREMGEMLMEIGRRFWFDHVVTGEPPPVDGTEGARRMLDKLFPRNRTALKEATPEVDELASMLKSARKAVEDAETRKAEIENRIIAAIGESEGFNSDGYRVTFKADKNGKRRFLFKDRDAA